LDRSDHFGALFSMVIPLNFYLYLKAPTRARKAWYAATLTILFIGIFFTYKRTAWTAIIAAFFIIQLFYTQFRRLFLVLLLVFLVVLGATWNGISQSEVVTNRLNSKLSTVEGRTNGWNAAISLWARQPFFGYGFGNYGTVAKKLGVQDAALENAHLDVLFGAGLFGFVPYVAWFAFILRDSIRLFRKSRQNGRGKLAIDQDLLVIFWGVFLGYLINYTTTIANVFPVTMVFYLLVGTLVGSQMQFLSSKESEQQTSIASIHQA
jgi:O-antigen ligase